MVRTSPRSLLSVCLSGGRKKRGGGSVETEGLHPGYHFSRREDQQQHRYGPLLFILRVLLLRMHIIQLDLGGVREPSLHWGAKHY